MAVCTSRRIRAVKSLPDVDKVFFGNPNSVVLHNSFYHLPLLGKCYLHHTIFLSVIYGIFKKIYKKPDIITLICPRIDLRCDLQLKGSAKPLFLRKKLLLLHRHLCQLTEIKTLFMKRLSSFICSGQKEQLGNHFRHIGSLFPYQVNLFLLPICKCLILKKSTTLRQDHTDRSTKFMRDIGGKLFSPSKQPLHLRKHLVKCLR